MSLWLFNAYPFLYEIRHLLSPSLHLPEIPQLVARADEVVLGVADLVVDVTVQVVGEEAHGLHHGEQRYSKRQIVPLNGCEESSRRIQIPTCECLEDVPAEFDTVQFRRIFWLAVGRCAQEIAIVGEDVSRHHGVQINDAEHITIFIEEHVVHFRVAVTDAFGKQSLSV